MKKDRKKYNIDEMHQIKGNREQVFSKLSPPLIIYGVLILIVFFIIFITTFKLQVYSYDTYKEQSLNNLLKRDILFSKRGDILDRNGVVLATSDLGENVIDRKYTFDNGFSHITGYSNLPQKDTNGYWYREYIEGITGIEQLHDSVLRGKNGKKFVERNSTSDTSLIYSLSDKIDGGDVQLTIDSRIQTIFYEELKKLADQYDFLSSIGVLMDLSNGDVIALANYPDYDTNVLTQKTDKEKIRDYQIDERDVFLNRALSGLFTPGSSVKPFFGVAALEENIVDPTTTFVSTGSVEVPNPYDPSKPTIFKDWKAHGPVDLQRAIAVSSNVYFYYIGGGLDRIKPLGIDGINKWVKRFKLTDQTELFLSNEPLGVTPSRDWKRETFNDEWRIGDTLNTVIGQYGFQITPLQLTRSIGIIATNGEIIEPRITFDTKIKKEKLDISESALRQVRIGMRRAVTEGTSRRLNGIDYVDVAVKSGTAQSSFNKEKINAILTGFFPYKDPKYVFTVVFEKGDVKTTENVNVTGQAIIAILDRINAVAPEYIK